MADSSRKTIQVVLLTRLASAVPPSAVNSLDGWSAAQPAILEGTLSRQVTRRSPTLFFQSAAEGGHRPGANRAATACGSNR
jgi:hypothetical protein